MSSFRYLARIRSITSALSQSTKGHGIATAQTVGCNGSRHMSFVRLEKEKDADFAILYLSRKPANSFNKVFKEELIAAIAEVEADPSMHGLIITSDVPKIFSAGADLTEFYQRSPKSIREFGRALLMCWLALYSSRLVTIAAINGHVLAGGVALSLVCDYRIMSDGRYKLGLVETQRGIIIPPWLSVLVRNTVGLREAERAVQLGTAYKPEDALRAGFIDEVVDQDKLMERAREEMAAYLKIPHATRVACKLELRRELIERLKEEIAGDNHAIVDHFSTLEAQENIRKFIKREK